jgi:hypothetical protein
LSGSYTYTNRFVLPPGADPLTASISGRWASFIGTGTMYFNGSSMPVSSSSMNLLNLISLAWTHFIINSNFLAYPATNTITFVVTIPYQDFTGLRVEFTDASVSCGSCTPPSITQKTLNQSLPLNSTAVFSVGVWGTPPLTIQWYHNGVPLTNGVHYPNGVTNTTLTITPLGYADAGTYYIAVTNSCGGTTSTPSKLTITKGWPWPWAWWNFAQIGYPMKAAVGPDLIMDGTNIFGVSSGTTDDYGLPGIGGKTANVMYVSPMLSSGTPIQLPFITPSDGSGSVSNYTLIMNVYFPDDSTNPITLFSLSNPDGSRGLIVANNIGEYWGLSVVGTSGGLPFEIDSSMPLTSGAWKRVALVISWNFGDGTTASLYLDGAPVGSTSITKMGAGTLTLSQSSLATVFSSPMSDGTNGGVYVSSLQFHDDAMTPEMIASIGDSDVPMSASNPSGGVSTALKAATQNSMVTFAWTGDAFVLQEATDLTIGDWKDSMMPFMENSDVAGNVTTTASVNPTNGPAKFYRLIYRP